MTKKNIADIFGDLFPELREPDDGISDRRKIELQKQMIIALAERVTSLETTVAKLKANNNKTVPQVQNLTTRVGELEARENQ